MATCLHQRCKSELGTRFLSFAVAKELESIFGIACYYCWITDDA